MMPSNSIEFRMQDPDRIDALRRFWAFLRAPGPHSTASDALQFLDEPACDRLREPPSAERPSTPEPSVAPGATRSPSSEAAMSAGLRWIVEAADNPDVRLHDIQTLDRNRFRLDFQPMASPWGSTDFMVEVVALFGGHVLHISVE